jgi:hypothetical protein
LSTAGLRRDRLWNAYRKDVLLTYYRRQFASARPLLWDYWLDHPGDWRILAYALISMLPVKIVTALRGRVASPCEGNIAETGDSSGHLRSWDSALEDIRRALARKCHQ